MSPIGKFGRWRYATDHETEVLVAVDRASVYASFWLAVYIQAVFEKLENRTLGYGVAKDVLEEFGRKALEWEDVCHV
jgi:hypothetical protein